MKVTKKEIYNVLRKHTGSVNSFIDENGKNRFMECVDRLHELYAIPNFGKELHRRRIAADMSQEFLAKLMGWTKSYIAHIESGKRLVDEKQQRRLLTAVRFYSEISL